MFRGSVNQYIIFFHIQKVEKSIFLYQKALLPKLKPSFSNNKYQFLMYLYIHTVIDYRKQIKIKITFGFTINIIIFTNANIIFIEIKEYKISLYY